MLLFVFFRFLVLSPVFLLDGVTIGKEENIMPKTNQSVMYSEVALVLVPVYAIHGIVDANVMGVIVILRMHRIFTSQLKCFSCRNLARYFVSPHEHR